MLKMPPQEEQQQKAVNLTWVVIVLALVALLEGIQRGALVTTMWRMVIWSSIFNHCNKSWLPSEWCRVPAF